MTTCRRCSVCEGASHHWLDNPDFGDDDGSPEMQEATHVCKHCPVLGMECEACDGNGIGNLDEWEIDALADKTPCQECNGEGVKLLNPQPPQPLEARGEK